MRNRGKRHLIAIALLAIVLAAASTTPADAKSSSGIVPFRKVDDDAKTVQDMRDRAISLPELGADDICPVSAYPEPVLGFAGAGVTAGPVGAVGIGVNGVLRFASESTTHWFSSKILWIADADVPPLLVRGRRLDGSGKVAFRTSGAASASSLVLDQDARSNIPPEWRDQPSGPRVRESGCYALQIDGPDFQSTIVFRAIVGDVDVPSTRTFALRDVRLDRDEAAAFGFHPTRDPVTIEATTDGLEVCPADLADVFNGRQTAAAYWFDVCLPLEQGVALELPPPPVDHIALLVRSRTGAPVRSKRLSVAYEPGDGFFHLAAPPLGPHERSGALVITPTTWDVVVSDPAQAGGSTSGIETVVTQHGRRVPVTEVEDTGRGGQAYGPVALGEEIAVHWQNATGGRRALSVAVYWD